MKISQQIVITMSNINEKGELLQEKGVHLSVTGIDTEVKSSQEVRVGVHHNLNSHELAELKNILTNTLDNAIRDRRAIEEKEKGPSYTVGDIQHYQDN